MKHKQHYIPAQLLLRLATLIALTLAFLFSGCEVFKKVSHHKSDSIAVKKSTVDIDNVQDDGNKKTEENNSREENEWSRLTMKWLAEKKDGDTTINNFITQPATVIYERGKTSRDETKRMTDSSWYHTTLKMFTNAIDSISRKTTGYEKDKHVDTKIFPWWLLLMIATGVYVLFKRFIPVSPKLSGGGA